MLNELKEKELEHIREKILGTNGFVSLLEHCKSIPL